MCGLNDRLRCSFATGDTSRQGSYFSPEPVLTISPTVERICPSRSKYIMHAASKILCGRSKCFNAGFSGKVKLEGGMERAHRRVVCSFSHISDIKKDISVYKYI